MEKKKYFTFIVDNEYYALSIDIVNQIIGIQNVTPIPKQSKHLIGVINLRGVIVPVIDFRLLLGLETFDYTEKMSIVITENGDELIGFVVDEVSEILEFEDKDIMKQSDKKIKKDNVLLEGFYKNKEFIIKVLYYNQIINQ